MSATSYNVAWSSLTVISGGSLTFTITPVGGNPSAADRIAIAAVITTTAGTAPTPITSAEMPVDGSAPTFLTAIPANFTGTIAFTIGSAGNSNTLNLPISGSTQTFNVSNATGLITNEASLLAFLGTNNLAVLSNQDNNASVPYAPSIQNAINFGESRVISKLASRQCISGMYFKLPFTVNKVPLLQATGSVALYQLQYAANQYAANMLDKWRMLQNASDDSSANVVQRIAAAWEKDADANLEMILNYTYGYDTDVLYVDLDTNTGAVRGEIYRNISNLSFGQQCVNPDGTPIVPIYGPLTWTTWALYDWGAGVAYGGNSPGGYYPWLGVSE